MFPAAVRARYAGAHGISFFLLVSVRVGDSGFSSAGNRVSKAENLNFVQAVRQGFHQAGLSDAALPPYGGNNAPSA
jgi:hypothetical protein